MRSYHGTNNISPVPALSRAALVDPASVDPVYVQSSGSGEIRPHNLPLQYHSEVRALTTAPPRPDINLIAE